MGHWSKLINDSGISGGDRLDLNFQASDNILCSVCIDDWVSGLVSGENQQLEIPQCSDDLTWAQHRDVIMKETTSTSTFLGIYRDLQVSEYTSKHLQMYCRKYTHQLHRDNSNAQERKSREWWTQPSESQTQPSPPL